MSTRKKLKNEDPPPNKEDLERHVYNAMRSLGWIIPTTEEDVERAETALSKEEVELPEELKDPYQTLESIDSDCPPFESEDLPVDAEVEENLARAAREGGVIWPEIEERMQRPTGGRAKDHMTTDNPRPVFLSAAHKREIAELAEAVAEEYSPEAKVEPEKIAQAKEITLSFGSYSDAFDGMLEHLAGRFHIVCNLDRVGQRNSPRARFTLGHELGHFYIDEHRNALTHGRAPAHPRAANMNPRIRLSKRRTFFHPAF